jgi:hypothetical protein
VLPSSDGFKGAGIRNVSPKGTKSVVLDCQISMNTPPVGAHTTVRGAHLGTTPIPRSSTQAERTVVRGSASSPPAAELTASQSKHILSTPSRAFSRPLPL